MVTFLMIFSVVVLIKCIGREEDDKEKETGKKEKQAAYIKKVRFEQFAGSAACANCHKDIYLKHIETAHYRTSQPALEKYIRGSFERGKNIYTYSFTPSVILGMEKRDSGFFQVVYQNYKEIVALHFDVVTGSGAKGQSYLYWRNNSLFQMPISYYTMANQWSSSPGFPGKLLLDRPITSRCLECHTTFAETISVPGKMPEEFDPNRILFGVDCEKCHGPAAQHVEFQTKNPNEKSGKYIVNPASLTRQQSLDLCASCHGGAKENTKPPFEFTVGDTLSNYFVLSKLDTAAPDYHNIDVHGNQYGLLAASKCFTMSKMTCNSCHNTHENERGNIKLFSQRCVSCHKADHGKVCKMTATMGPVIKSNCIDCHMPAAPSRIITLKLPDQNAPTAALVRSHFISIYPDEVKKFVTGKGKLQKKSN
jgi:hypothetical protein